MQAMLLRFFRPLPDGRAFRGIAAELLNFLEEEGNRSLFDRLLSLQKHWLIAIAQKDSFLLPDFLKARSIASTLQKGIEEESQEMGERLYELLSTAPVRSHFWSSPYFNDLLLHAFEADLANVLRLLPRPTEHLPILVLKLQEIEEALGDILGQKGESSLVLAPGVKLDPEEILKGSFLLLESVQSIAKKPEEELLRLDAALSILEGNAETLAGVVHRSPDEVKQTLNVIREGARARSAPELLSLVNIIRSLRVPEDAGIRTAMMETALQEMRTGFSTLRASLAPGETPQAEAAALLSEGLGPDAALILQSEDVRKKQDLLLSMLKEELPLLDDLFSRMSEGERKEFDADIVRWQAISLHGARTSADILDALRGLREIVVHAENTVRAHAPLPLRVLYRLQDYLGIRS
jgi:hypothetical protein